MNFKIMLASASVFLASCGFGDQSSIESAGIQSQQLGSLWWIFLGITAAVYVIVMMLLVVAFFRVQRAGPGSAPDIRPDEARDKKIANIIKGGVAVTVITLFALMITSFQAGRAIDTLSRAQGPLEIKVTGQQWWWQVEYQDPTPSNMVTTANEIHIPIGRPIKIDLVSHDVIHSFWVPNLHGKKDLVPNYPTTIFLVADKPGIYWGQCAEYCGFEHAKMRLMVVAESPDDFNAWYSASQKPASASLENTRENLMNWISDPQAIKPGIRMPMNTYTPEDLNALVDYIQNLK